MLQVIVEKCKHTNEQEVNYTAYCDQLIFSNPVHLTRDPKTDLVSYQCFQYLHNIILYTNTDIHTHNGRNVNKIAP